MFDFICVSRIGLHSVIVVCVVLCVATAVSVCIVSTSVFGVSDRRGNIEFATCGVNINFSHAMSLEVTLCCP